MQWLDPRRGLRRAAVGVAVVGAAALALSACTSGGSTAAGGTNSAPRSSAAPSAPVAPPTTPAPTSTAADPAVVSAVPALNSKGVNPATPISVSVANGTLVSVKLTNPAGKVVKGAIAANGTSWRSGEVLGYDKTYSVTATAKNGDGTAVVKTGKITTIAPDNQTAVYLQRIGGYPLGKNQTYGVGVVPVVHFDEPISDKAAAEKAIAVTTTPHVDGAWYWSDDQNAHYRPKDYWPSGTKVTIDAKIYGVQVGHGLYGQADNSTSFTIGRKQVTIAYDTAPKSVNKVRVYNAAGAVIKTMNTSMGKHGGTTVKGNYINYYTLDGTYTVLGHEQPAKMCSASYGLPADAPGGYACEPIYNATKISVDGIYLHELTTTIWAQNNGEDVSHGCLNLNTANSKWYFDHSLVGDPVVIHGNKNAPKLQVWQGGDWGVPWATWVKGGSA